MSIAQRRHLSELAFEHVLTRRYIIASYWVVILLALPLWWQATSISRLALPGSRVEAQQNRELLFPVKVHLTSVKGDQHAVAVGKAVHELLGMDVHFQRSSGIDIQVSAEGKADPSAYEVILEPGEGDHVVAEKRLHFRHSPETNDAAQADAVSALTDTLAKLISPYTTRYSSAAQAQHVMKYAPRYQLAFTLLNEDAASGTAFLSWDVQGTISTQILPLLSRLSVLHNFTIESQVQYHAPLAFQPRRIEVGGSEAHGLTHEDLTVFVNSAEWTLSSSVSNDPVIHLVLFIPSANHAPLHILEPDGTPSTSNAFILPQWGGIVILNPADSGPFHLPKATLDDVFATFQIQLTSLLGLPGLPHGVQRGVSEPSIVTDWELDTLMRRRALENVKSTKETLRSIVRLVDQIENMPVGQDVKGDVQDALASLDETFMASRANTTGAMQHSAKAATLSSRAFFNPGMLALLYFPAEHTYAVYTPLFASIAAPLVGALVREVLAWRRSRREKTAGIDERGRAKAE